jgi:MFS family permease
MRRESGVYDAYTAHHHLRAVAGTGVVSGIFLLNEYVVRRDLGGSRWHVLTLLLLPALAQSLAVLWNPVAPGRLLGRRPFRAFGIPVFAALALVALPGFPHEAGALVAVLVLCGVAQALLVPVQNGILARNYGERTRGRSFGRATAVQAIAIVCVSLPAGWLLDHDPTRWPWVYLAASGAGVVTYASWSKIRQRRALPPPADLERHGSALEALRRDRPFFWFEACFMVYGTGFLMMQPVLPLHLIDAVDVTYGEVGIARGLIFWLGMILSGSLFGRLADRIGILRVAALGFLALAGFPLLLLLVPGVVGLFLAFAVFGLAMTAVNLAWNLGPIVLARGRDPLPYLNAHVALVGLRALIGMTTGVALHATVGSHAVFLVVIGLEVVAAAGMWAAARASGRRYRPGALADDVTLGPETPAAP